MYQTYFNFKEEPFSITADPTFFFGSVHHEEAIGHLVYGIQSRKGIMVITGEIGTGKTTLCRTLLNSLDDSVKTALILNPNFSETQLLQLIIKDLGIYCRRRSKVDLIDALNQFLIEQSSIGNNVVIIIDESQNLNVRQLEHIRLLSNLETEKHKLLQIILVGQPELFDKLRLPELRQLNQRISVRYHLLPLQESEIREYVLHRLKMAGANNDLHFTHQAFEALFFHSQGTPRLINIICDRALLAGYSNETKIIDDKIINRCAREVK